MNQKNNIKFGTPTNLKGIAPNILPGVQPDSLLQAKCNTCGETKFTPVYEIKLASPLQTQNGQPTMVQFHAGFACTMCWSLNPFGEKKEPAPTPESSDLSISASDGIKTEEKLK